VLGAYPARGNEKEREPRAVATTLQVALAHLPALRLACPKYQGRLADPQIGTEKRASVRGFIRVELHRIPAVLGNQSRAGDNQGSGVRRAGNSAAPCVGATPLRVGYP
jgi:hypothetical protein